MRYRHSRKRKSKAMRNIIVAVTASALIGAVYYFFIGIEFLNRDFGQHGKKTPVVSGSDYQPKAPEYSTLTNPANFGYSGGVMVGDVVTDRYNRTEDIMFPDAGAYTHLEGVTTFRGNNYRDAPNYGTASVQEKRLEIAWHADTGSIGRWAGSGWTGQPLIINWPEKTKAAMNISEDKKSKEDLKEVILASLDGNIYFLDLDDGTYTRDPINIGAPVKGTASVDPRGYPLYYVGQGLNSAGSDIQCEDMYFRIYSLIDGKLLYKFGAESADPFAYRTNWQAYDSSPLIDSKTDTLIEPGENGVLYTLKLNSYFDAASGALAIDPDDLEKYRYTTDKNKRLGVWGMEDSAVGWKEYLFFTDNAGILQCLNLNTLETVYVNDLFDDSDVTMALEEAGEKIYLYTGCEVDVQDEIAGDKGKTYVRKINGMTGEVIWEYEYSCFKGGSVDGGVLSSPVLGKNGLSGIVIFNITMTGSKYAGELVALDKETGDVVWEHTMSNYGWASPVPVYTEDGKGYIIQCNSKGTMYLLDGKTGDVLSSVSLEHNIEASPAVYDDMIVVGTRGGRIYGVKIS